MALSDFTIITRSMKARLFSTVTTVVTVAVAVALMLVLLSMRDSGRRAFERGSGNMHLLVSSGSSAMESVLNGVFYADVPRRSLTWAQYNDVSTRFPFQWTVPTQQGDSYHGYPTLATTPEFFTDFKPAVDQDWALRDGSYFTKDFEVVAGAVAADGEHLKVGDKIVLTHGSAGSRQGGLSLASSPSASSAAAGGGGAPPHVHEQFKFTVVGVLKPTGTSHDRALFVSLNSSWILHAFDRREREEHAAGKDHDDHDAHDGHAEPDGDADEHDHDHDHADHHDEPPMTAADLTEADRLITGIMMRVASRPGSDATAMLPQVFDALRRDPTLTVASPADEVKKLFVIVGGVNQLLLAMAAAVVVSSGIAIMLALYNSMEQRRRQIAILRVLGCSSGRIFGLIITESALIGVLGVLAGGVLSVGAGLGVSAALKQRLGMVITPVYGADWVLAVALGAVLLACLAGLVPAVVAYRTSVAKNLKPAA